MNKKNNGFTLIELIVSTTIFIILISTIVTIFINTIKTQRRAKLLSESLGSVSLAIEKMSKEIRIGYNFREEVDPDGEEVLLFIYPDIAAAGVVSYKEIDLPNGNKGIGRCIGLDCLSNPNPYSDNKYTVITPEDVNIRNMEFIVNGNEASDGMPPIITIVIQVFKEDGSYVSLQSTVSSRILDT